MSLFWAECPMQRFRKRGCKRMSQIAETTTPALIDKNHQQLLDDWIAYQKRDGALRTGQIKEAELADQSRRFLSELGKGAAAGRLDDIAGLEWSGTREILEELARSRAVQGFTPSETANFVFSLKEPLFALLQQKTGSAPA